MKEEIQYHDKIKHISDKGIKIYPELVMGKSGKFWDHKYFVTVSDPKKILYFDGKKMSEVPHTSKTVNSAIEQTVNHIYEKLTK